MASVILHVDLDSFFAQAELIRNPSLRGKPVVICVYSGRSPDSGAVSTASYEARKYDVRSGMPIIQAKRLLKDVAAEFIRVDMPYYRQLSEEVMSRLEEFADEFEQVSVDEAYLDVTNRMKGRFEDVEPLCAKIKQTVKTEFSLTCSIGAATSKCTSKIAAGQRKPDGLTVIVPSQTREFLAPLPVEELPGIGSKTAKILDGIGIHTLEELGESPEHVLVEQFGRNLASYFRLAAVGEYYEPVKDRGEASQIGRMITLKEDTNDFGKVWSSLETLVADVQQKMRQRGVACKACTVTVITGKMDGHSKSISHDHPIQNTEALNYSAQLLLRRLIADVKDDFRRVGFRVSNLSEVSGQSKLSEFVVI